MNPYTNRVMIKTPENFYNRKAEIKKYSPALVHHDPRAYPLLETGE